MRLKEETPQERNKGQPNGNNEVNLNGKSEEITNDLEQRKAIERKYPEKTSDGSESHEINEKNDIRKNGKRDTVEED